MTPQENAPGLPVSVQESPAEVWVGDGLLQSWSTMYSSACMGNFEGGHHYLQVAAQAQEGREELLHVQGQEGWP